MQLYLRIGIYRGGAMWKKCWESIKHNLDLFDGVYLSFNLSEMQNDDIAVIGDVKSEKIHWIRQERFLTAEQHGIVIDRWLRTFPLEGHIYMLSHDDILVRDGLLELRSLNLHEDDAVLGSAVFFSEGKEKFRSVIARELGGPASGPMPLKVFISTWDSLMLNVSRLVIPAAAFRSSPMVWHLLKYGCWAELCYLCNPFIRRIYQTSAPTVKILWHDDSETARTPTAQFLFDSVLLRLHIFSLWHDWNIRRKMAADVGYIIRHHLFRGTFYFIQAQIRLMKLRYYHFSTGLAMIGCFFQIIAGKIRTRLTGGRRNGGRS